MTTPRRRVLFAAGKMSLITSVRLTEGPGHDRVEIWNRGAKAGEIVVNLGEGRQVAERLLVRVEREAEGGEEVES